MVFVNANYSTMSYPGKAGNIDAGTYTLNTVKYYGEKQGYNGTPDGTFRRFTKHTTCK